MHTESLAAAARPPPEPVDPDVRGEDVRHARPHQRRPADDPLHHRRQRSRAAARGRLPRPRRALRPHARVHPDREEGVGRTRSRSTTRASTTSSTTSSPTSSRSSSTRRSASAGRPTRPTRSAPQEADIYCLWGEPLKDTAEQIERIATMCAAAGKPRPEDPGRVPADPRADRGRGVGAGVRDRRAHQASASRRTRGSASGSDGPQNTGSQAAHRHRRAGRALRPLRCTRGTALATGGSGNSNALVGTPETVAAALLDYVDLGVDILSARGYDSLQDTIDFGQQVIPLVREEVAKLRPPSRDETGRHQRRRVA